MPARPQGRPRRWWLVALVGAAPHLAVLAHFMWPGVVEFAVVDGADLAAVPFALFSVSELYIVPATLTAAAVLAIVRRSRPWALWFLIGTLGGATAVLVNLAVAAVSWRWD